MKHGQVAVIGAGIVGLMTALEVQRSGRHVIVIDPGEPGGRHAASFGNAGWVSNGSIVPVSVPGLWRKVPGWLMDPLGPFAIRWRYLPRLLPWLARFLWAGRSWDQVERIALVKWDLCKSAAADHMRIAAEAGVPDLVRRDGQLMLFEDKAHFHGDTFEWKLRRRLGIRYRELGAAEIRALEPNVSQRYRFGILFEDGAHIADLPAYCRAITKLIGERSGEFVRARATGFEMREGHLARVGLDSGCAIECAQAVVTAGIGSKALAAAAGDRVSMASKRGYHVHVADSGKAIGRPIMPIDGLMGITPMRSGLRVAGQVELSSVDAPPDWRRADILARFLPRVFGNALHPATELDRWVGERPATPDDIPVIGPAPSCEGLFYAFGHGHSGVGYSPATAKAVAALLDGREPPFDLSRLSASRF